MTLPQPVLGSSGGTILNYYLSSSIYVLLSIVSPEFPFRKPQHNKWTNYEGAGHLFRPDICYPVNTLNQPHATAEARR